MRVCDRCHKTEKLTTLTAKGESFELCDECLECVANYIQFSYKPKKGFLGGMFG